MVPDLTGFEGLARLSLAHNRLESVDRLPLALRVVDLSHNAIVSLVGLKGLHSVVQLNVSHNALASLAGLESLLSLRVLDAGFNYLTCIDHLGHLADLSTLSVAHNLVAKFDSIRTLSLNNKLEALDISQNPLCDVRTMSGRANRARENAP